MSVRVPVAVALDLCDVTVAVLAGTVVDGPVRCTAEGGSIAIVDDGDDGGPVDQDGPRDVNLQDVDVQVPIAIAADVRDVDVGVLVGRLTGTGTSECDAGAGSIALIG